MSTFKVTKDATVYLHIPQIDAKTRKQLNIDPCCKDACSFCSMVMGGCLFTVLIPVTLWILADQPVMNYAGDGKASLVCKTTAIIFIAIGVLWFCCMTSFRYFCINGILCLPASSPAVATWSSNPTAAATTTTTGEEKNSDNTLLSNTDSAVKKLKVIVNPNAGVKAGSSNLTKCQKIWEDAGIEVTVINTTHAGHAREIGRDEDLKDCDALVAIGGDGTVHELVNGYLSRSDNTGRDTTLPPLGFIPGGSGNSIMAQQGTWDVEEAASRIAKGNVKDMDIVEVNACGETIASLNTICFGLTGVIGVIAEDMRCLGPARYDVVAVWKIMTGIREFTKLDIIDEEGRSFRVEDEMTTVYINTTQHFGKGKRCAPLKQSDDGLMDIYALKGVATRGMLMAALLQLPTGAHVNSPVILHWRAKKCTLTLPTAGVFNVDGEIVKHDGVVTMTMHQQRQKIFAKPDSVAMCV